MLRFLTDEDYDGRLTRALLSRVQGLDLLRVQDVGLMHTPDSNILAWVGRCRPLLALRAQSRRKLVMLSFPMLVPSACQVVKLTSLLTQAAWPSQ